MRNLRSCTKTECIAQEILLISVVANPIFESKFPTHVSRFSLEVIGGHNLKLNKLLCVFLPAILIFFGLLIFHKPILGGAGKFLAPTSDEGAETVILEGTDIVKKGAPNAGLELLSDGKAKSLVVVLHHPSKDRQVFAIQENYPQLVLNELKHLGLEMEKVQVISVPIGSHPITLAEARFVVSRLSQQGIRSAILLSEGFHTRRSFWVYSQEGNRVGLHVVPFPYFIEYESNSWWHDAQGISDFVNENLKLAYYLLNGYVSIKSLW